MKKSLIYLAAITLVAVVFVSCENKEDSFEELLINGSFDKSLLTGKWVSGTLYYNYSSNGTGKTWDLADDVTEAEAQSFTWTLDKGEFNHVYIMEIGGSVPKFYAMMELTSTKLKYKDNFGSSFSFTKVSK